MAKQIELWVLIFVIWFLLCCRGRDRTSTEQLAIMHGWWSTPTLLPYVTFILLSPPPRREGMSAKNFITPQYVVQRTITVQY